MQTQRNASVLKPANEVQSGDRALLAGHWRHVDYAHHLPEYTILQNARANGRRCTTVRLEPRELVKVRA